MMPNEDTTDSATLESMEKLINAIRLAQCMAQKITFESHGELYDEACLLDDLLHQARLKAEEFEQKIH